MAVLDSSFLIDLQLRRPGALKRLDALKRDRHPLRVPAAAWVEYLSRLAPDLRLQATRALEAGATFEAFGREYADEAARLQHELLEAGRRIAWHDLQILATASYLREPVVTNDSAMGRVPGVDTLGH